MNPPHQKRKIYISIITSVSAYCLVHAIHCQYGLCTYLTMYPVLKSHEAVRYRLLSLHGNTVRLIYCLCQVGYGIVDMIVYSRPTDRKCLSISSGGRVLWHKNIIVIGLLSESQLQKI